MAKKRTSSPKKPMRERLLDATATVFLDNGLAGTTLKKVAAEARCSGATLHNLYESRDHLIADTVRRELATIDRTVPQPLGDLRSDLVQLATNYYDYYTQRPFLLYALPDIARSEKLTAILHEEQDRTVAKLAYLYVYYKNREEWAPQIQLSNPEDIADQAVYFLSAIFGKMTWDLAGLTTHTFNPAEYVDLFLNGYAAKPLGSEERSFVLVASIDGADIIDHIVDDWAQDTGMSKALVQEARVIFAPDGLDENKSGIQLSDGSKMVITRSSLLETISKNWPNASKLYEPVGGAYQDSGWEEIDLREHSLSILYLRHMPEHPGADQVFRRLESLASSFRLFPADSTTDSIVFDLCSEHGIARKLMLHLVRNHEWALIEKLFFHPQLETSNWRSPLVRVFIDQLATLKLELLEEKLRRLIRRLLSGDVVEERYKPLLRSSLLTALYRLWSPLDFRSSQPVDVFGFKAHIMTDNPSDVVRFPNFKAAQKGLPPSQGALSPLTLTLSFHADTPKYTRVLFGNEDGTLKVESWRVFDRNLGLSGPIPVEPEGPRLDQVPIRHAVPAPEYLPPLDQVTPADENPPIAAPPEKPPVTPRQSAPASEDIPPPPKQPPIEKDEDDEVVPPGKLPSPPRAY